MELTAFIIIGIIMAVYFVFFKNKDTGSNKSEMKNELVAMDNIKGD